ncbi:hypothetical protein E2C01_068512 [Portunus trituberculatus]|uniref:Uncharacterized protein n=1 Tax=Portunus trituberculatus TaxID=210409 RepID=A0A5B7HS67_PORTR|nr:hypothetical protein [Portunus trituberculatus]
MVVVVVMVVEKHSSITRLKNVRTLVTFAASEEHKTNTRSPITGFAHHSGLEEKKFISLPPPGSAAQDGLAVASAPVLESYSAFT